MPRVTNQELVRENGLRIPKGQPVLRAQMAGAGGLPLYTVMGAAHFLPQNSAFLHDAIHYGIHVSEDETEEEDL